MKKINAKLVGSLFIVIVLIGVLLYYYQANRPEPKTGPIVDLIVEQELSQEVIEAYFQNNINQLSPVDPVLGGTFYLTEINFINNNLVILSYEDGHIALIAEVNFHQVGSEIIIDSLEIINE
ncbi:MAG: hypothetical protein EOM88_00020 [Clostridia bacterium]|nr:hypothetical protein [Clostridia bacterium]